jgi:hypothetical protein
MGFIATVLFAAALQVAPSSSAASRAFESYEAVRVALAGDRFDGPAVAQATALVPLAEEVGGAAFRQAAEALAAAADIKAARKAFGELSKLIVPKFQEAALDGVRLFECPMVKQPWAQRGGKIENPYFGKSMLTCGNPIKEKK